jgi:hypothetical protein
MIRPFLPAALLFAFAALTQAQLTPANSPIKIESISPTFEKTPDFSIGLGPQRKAPSQDWLWVEVAFTYQPKAPSPQPAAAADIQVDFYVLLANPSKLSPAGTLLTASMNLVGVVPGNQVHHTVALVSPQVLKSLFGGKAPTSVASAFQAVGVTMKYNGQLAGELSIGKGKGRAQWWQALQPGPQGLLLSKDQTPFAPLFYDYFEVVKAK